MKIPQFTSYFSLAFSRRFERIADRVLSRSKAVPERNPQSEDLTTPGIDTIKKLVTEIEK